MKDYYDIGICIFGIAYALMESSNAIYVYGKDKNNRFNLIIILSWGILILLSSLGVILEFSNTYMNIIFTFWGVIWFPLMYVPCTLKFYKINKYTIFIRRAIFFILGISLLTIVILSR